MGILTLEDFNTLLGLYGGITSEYTIDSSIFTGAGKYEFLDVTVSSSNYVVEVVNSLFTGAYTVLTGASVSYSNGKFTFPTNQSTRIKILLGANNSSKLEFTKFVARPCHQDYVCSMIAKDASGNILANKSVSIGSYTGTTNSNGEVSITIPKNKADIYQYPVSVDNVEMDTLELLRTKISLNPVCTTTVLYNESTNTLSFNLGNIGHSVSCKCVINGYTYTASSNSSTGVVSFTIHPISNEGMVGGSNIPSSVTYDFKVFSDDWVYEANLTGTVNCEYYTVTSWSNLVSAYNNSNIGAVKINGTITAPTLSEFEITRDFKIIGGTNNQLTGNGILQVLGSACLQLNNVNFSNTNNTTFYILLNHDNAKAIINGCNISSTNTVFLEVIKGEIECWNSTFTNCLSPIFTSTYYYQNTSLYLDNCEFNISEFGKTVHDFPLIIDNPSGNLDLRIQYCRFNVEFEGTDNEGIGVRPALFRFSNGSTVNYNQISNLENTLLNSTISSEINCDITINGTVKQLRGSNKAFIWYVNSNKYSINVTEE